MPKPSEVVAVLCGDIHLQHTPPPCHDTDDWYGVMQNYLIQLQDVAMVHDVPILCTGDVFDKWNSPVELVNFALRWLPSMYAVPGQHDLPYHNYELRGKSAYGNLVIAGVIKDLVPGVVTHLGDGLAVVGFPWEHEVGPICRLDDCIHIAIAHRYVWIKGKSFPGADDGARAKSYKESLKGFDAAAFGDNHKGFKIKVGNCTLFNNGTFMRRKSDELEYAPQVGLLMGDGTVKVHRLDTSKDKFRSTGTGKKKSQFDSFIRELKNTDAGELDYAAEIHRRADDKKISKPTADLLLKSIEQ